MVTLHDVVNSVYFILHSSFDTNLLHFFLLVHSLFLLYTWKTDHTNGHEVINFTGQYWLCRKVCVALCIMVANVIHYNCVSFHFVSFHFIFIETRSIHQPKKYISHTLEYLRLKLYTITLKAVFRECRALDLKNVIDLTFKYPQRLCVPYIAW